MGVALGSGVPDGVSGASLVGLGMGSAVGLEVGSGVMIGCGVGCADTRGGRVGPCVVAGVTVMQPVTTVASRAAIMMCVEGAPLRDMAGPYVARPRPSRGIVREAATPSAVASYGRGRAIDSITD